MKYIKLLSFKLGVFISLFYSEKIARLFCSIRIYIYTGLISGRFKTCGNNCYFDRFGKIVGERYVSMGNSVSTGVGVIIEAYDRYLYTDQKFNPHIILGDNCRLGDYSHLSCVNRIELGNGVRCGRMVFITDNSHGISDQSQLEIRPNLRPLHSKGSVIIEDNVWIGEMVCILPNVHIGKGSIIGANSVVTHDVPPYCVVGGNPAKILKQM